VLVDEDGMEPGVLVDEDGMEPEVLTDEDGMEPGWVISLVLDNDPDVNEKPGTGGADPDVNEMSGNAVDVLLPTFERDGDGLTVPGVTEGADRGG